MFFFYYYFWNLFMQSVTLPVTTPVKALFPRGSFGHGAAQFWMFQMSNKILKMTQGC